MPLGALHSPYSNNNTCRFFLVYLLMVLLHIFFLGFSASSVISVAPSSSHIFFRRLKLLIYVFCSHYFPHLIVVLFRWLILHELLVLIAEIVFVKSCQKLPCCALAVLGT